MFFLPPPAWQCQRAAGSGDGGFQMTGPDIAHAPRLGLAPLVVLVDNGGWGIFRPVTPRQEQLDLPRWPYAELAQAWGGTGFQAGTADELHAALRAAHRVQGFALVECRLGTDDLSPISRRYIRASVKKGRANPGA